MLKTYLNMVQAGQLNAARDCLQDSLLNQLSSNQDFTVDELNTMGEAYNNLGQSETALHYFVMAYEKYAQSGHHDQSLFLKTIHNIGLAVGAMGYFKESLDIFVFCLEQCDQKIPIFLKIIFLNSAGFAYENILDYQKAMDMYQNALNLMTTIKADQTELDLLQSKLLNSIGLVSVYMNNLEAAEKFLQESLDLKAKCIGEKHPEYAITLNNLGLLEQKRKNYTLAMDYFKTALQVRQDSLSVAHPAYNRTLYHIADTLFAQGAFTNALNLSRMVLAFRDNFYPVGHPQILLTLDLITKINNALKVDATCSLTRLKSDKLNDYGVIINKFSLNFLLSLSMQN